MNTLVVNHPENSVQCHSCEDACPKAFYKEERQDYSCVRIVKDRQDNDQIKTCTQCGKCAEVCPKFAITKNSKGVYVIDKELCVGCMACVDICPQDVICKSMDQGFATKCIACGICAKACPQDVLAVEDN